MPDVPVYVEAAEGESPEAYFRQGVVSTPLRRAHETAEARFDPGRASIEAATSKVLAALPNAATHEKIERIAEAAARIAKRLPSEAARASMDRIAEIDERVNRARFAGSEPDAFGHRPAYWRDARALMAAFKEWPK
jgi:hypothetical protein